MTADERARAHLAPVPRIALTVPEAAASLGVSRDHFDRHIARELRMIYSGGRKLVKVTELDRWAEQNAVRRG